LLSLIKSELRAVLLKKRAELNSHYRQQAEIEAVSLLSKSSLFMQSQHCACYLAMASEFNCFDMITLIWANQKKCYLPILTPEKKLKFGLYQQYDVLQMNRYHILEPVVDYLVAAADLDLVILPLVGFDKSGHRLGMGGGYYDRSFEFIKNSHRHKKPFLLGVAYACQEIEQLEADPWDIPLNGILTEKNLHIL